MADVKHTFCAQGVVSASPCRLMHVVVIVAGEAPLNIYDDASGACGTVVLAIPAGAPAGSFYNLELDLVSGIFVARGPGAPQIRIAWK